MHFYCNVICQTQPFCGKCILSFFFTYQVYFGHHLYIAGQFMTSLSTNSSDWWHWLVLFICELQPLHCFSSATRSNSFDLIWRESRKYLWFPNIQTLSTSINSHSPVLRYSLYIQHFWCNYDTKYRHIWILDSYCILKLIQSGVLLSP